MQMILNNPYRTVGLLVGATAREQTKQINKLKKYIEAEQDIQDDYSFPVLGNLNRTLEKVEDAVSKLNLDYEKMNAALFWFWNGNPITDEAAFEALKSGEIETANEIWEKLIIRTDEDGKRFWKPVTEKNYSAFHNCSILNIIRANGSLHNAVVSSLYFLQSDLVQKFISSVSDETHKTNKTELQLLFLNQLHSDIQESKKSSLSKFLEIINKQEFIAKQDFMKGLVQKPIEQIEHKIEIAKRIRKASKSKAANAGQELFTNTEIELTQLKSIVGTTDIKYTSVADKVANEILQCSIEYFNDSQEKDSTVDYTETALKLAKQADTIAVGNLTKDRVRDSINTLAEMKERVINEAIAILSSVKLAYENAINEINEQVHRMIMSMSLNQTINFSKVDKLKANCLNWDKVTEVVSTGISVNDITVIQRCSNQSKVSEYKSLVDFLFSKLGPIQINQVKHLCYWKDVRAAQANATAKKIGSTISSAADKGKCYIATMAYGSYEHPQVLELRRFRDNYLTKSIAGRLFIKAYYIISPGLVEILKNKKNSNAFIRKVLNHIIKYIKK